MIQDCSLLLSQKERLEALASTGLFGTRPEETFTRLNLLATKLLNAPISIFSLIGESTQFFKSAVGFEITESNNQVPIDISVCQYSLQGKPLSIEDTKNHPFFSKNPAVLALDIVGYLGVPVITKDGHSIGAVCVIDHKKRIWTKEEISILEAITASFMSEIELRQALATITREGMLREEFIAIASHELKNPLTSLKIQSQMIHKQLDAGKFDIDYQKKYVANVTRQIRRLELMVDDMSDATRLSTGKLKLHKTQVNLNELIQDVVDNISDTIVKSGSVLTVNESKNVSGNWDHSRLQQVLTNLILNATKYAPESRIEVSLSSTSEFVQISVMDNGPGISENDQATIFNKYGRASVETTVQGLGLGLYISRQIVEEHGGTLNLVSSPGKGSNFTVSLPIS